MIVIIERTHAEPNNGNVTCRIDPDELLTGDNGVTIQTGGQEITLFWEEIEPTIEMLKAFKAERDARQPAADGGL